MPAAYKFKHPNVKKVDSIDFKPTELAKKLFEISPKGQGFVGFVDLLTGDIHLCPVYNKNDGLERQAIMYEGVNYAVESMVPLSLTGTSTVTGGDAHKNARVKLKLMDDKEHSGNLLGFGCQKGKDNSLLESFRNRSASLNLLAIQYNERYLDLNTFGKIINRSMPDDITEKTIQALCKDLPADTNQERVLKKRELITPLDYSTAQFKQITEGMLLLHYAATRGRLIHVNSMLAHKEYSVHEADIAGWTPLTHAASQGHTEVVEALLKAGASVNAVDNAGQTPLMHAASRGRTEVVKALLQAGSAVDVTNNNNQTAFQCAIAHGKFKVAEILCVEAGVVTDDLTRLLIAVANDHYTADHAENVLNHAPNNQQETMDLILMEAVKNEDVNLAKKLIEKGASPGDVDQKPMGPLGYATYFTHSAMIEVLTQRTSPSQDNAAKEHASALNQLPNATGADKESSNNSKKSSTLNAYAAYTANIPEKVGQHENVKAGETPREVGSTMPMKK